MPAHFIIIGNGAAGLSAAEEIRRRDDRARITILSDEPHLFYSRPGLAYYLSGEIPADRVIARTPRDYQTQNIHLIHRRCTDILPDQHQVVLQDGRHLQYDALLIATGSRAVPAPFPGRDLDGIIYLDTLNQAKDIVRRTRRARTAAVIGGGITALELVEGLHARHVHTHYLLRRDRYWASLLSEEESAIIENRLTDMGIELHKRTQIVRVEGRKGRVEQAILSTGERLPVDLVGVAIGVRPNIDLARRAGLQCDRGILVDTYLRTSAADIYAAGDVAQMWDRWSGEHRVDALWPSAIASGRAAGANMAGAHQPYEKDVPFNVARLCGIMMTAIGQAAARHTDDERLLEISRGSSQVWTAFPLAKYLRIKRVQGSTSIRLVIRDRVLVGALLLGYQALATPLRELIAAGVDLSPILPSLQRGDQPIEDLLLDFWRAWKRHTLTASEETHHDV
ncbi:MAG: NAD(P)/FAD-dependent oxidoreductase [Chloroflexi bacterium]|nr:NAD(P)/FAD-dependent oxidoreductase [Chloroflexota bacterium]